VRHGETEWNACRRFQGTTDIGLSARGRRQAEALAQALRPRALVAAYSSPLRRALETAEIVLAGRGIPLTVLPELAEHGVGEWEGRLIEEIGEPYRRWVQAPLDCPPPGGEPLPAVAVRVRRAIETISLGDPARPVGAGAQVLVVAHGGVISVYACHLLGLSLNRLWRLRVDNASLTIVAPPRLVSFNETGHLPP
jgi:phosphoserine phosphatase